MKILTITLLLLAAVCNAQNPYAALSCDSVVIVDYGNMQTEDTNIEKYSNGYRFMHIPSKAKTLTKGETDELIERIGKKSSYGVEHATCYMPHLAVMFMKNGYAVEYVEVCTECNRLVSSLELEATKQGPTDVGEGQVYYLNSGLSNDFRKFLGEILTKYKFSHVPTGK